MMGSYSPFAPEIAPNGGGGALEEAIADLERRHPAGLTSFQVVAFFRERGVRLSEATFRRYVQLGLLPRCRRVGRKGRHRGSQGIYPASVARRLFEVKRLLGREMTIDEIRDAFAVREDDVQEIRERLARIVETVDARLREAPDEILARHAAELRDLAGVVEEKLRQVAGDVARSRQQARLAV
jgi:DNA-binding transcriptional MerR regulator